MITIDSWAGYEESIASSPNRDGHLFGDFGGEPADLSSDGIILADVERLVEMRLYLTPSI